MRQQAGFSDQRTKAQPVETAPKQQAGREDRLESEEETKNGE
jgi:hypothetical protein